MRQIDNLRSVYCRRQPLSAVSPASTRWKARTYMTNASNIHTDKHWWEATLFPINYPNLVTCCSPPDERLYDVLSVSGSEYELYCHGC